MKTFAVDLHQRLTGQKQCLVGMLLVALSCGWLGALDPRPAIAGEAPAKALEPLQVESVAVQGLRRSVRFYRPERLAARPALVVALHGGGGDGERFRRLTAVAFERLADEHGFLVAYPDALGGQWKDCRAETPWRNALSGIDDLAFLGVVVERAKVVAGADLGGVFAVGYSNGGHLVFRAALEAPGMFTALAAIGAHLPIPEQLTCTPEGSPPPILLVSGSDDPINPWAGGAVRSPDGVALGRVLSAEATAAWFREKANLTGEPVRVAHPDRETRDRARAETLRWSAAGRREVALLAVEGGGHSLPHPTAPFPEQLVGPTCRDLDGAGAIWDFFARHL